MHLVIVNFVYCHLTHRRGWVSFDNFLFFLSSIHRSCRHDRHVSYSDVASYAEFRIYLLPLK